MKINKKLLALMMSLTIVGAALTGCGQKDNNTQPQASEQAQDNTAQDTPTAEDTTQDAVTEGNTDDTAEADPTPSQELFFVVTDGIELPATMQMPEDMFNDTYGIDKELLDSYYVAMPMMNVTATEIAVFELKDETKADQVIEGIKKRQSALEAQWKSYLPEQLELVQNYETAVKGNKVIFVISERKDDILKKFNELA